MSRVVITDYRTRSITARDKTSLTHPLARRMTLLQKATLETLASLERDKEALFRRAFRDHACPLILATSFGELSASLAVAEGIYRRELPVSPLAFQHSVHNVAAGYFSILHQLATPHLVVSSGYLSLDKGLVLAAARIRSGYVPAVCLVSVEERVARPPEANVAEAELILLMSPSLAEGHEVRFELSECTHLPHEPSAWRTPAEGDTACLREPPGGGAPERLGLDGQAENFCRRVVSKEGDAVMTVWKRGAPRDTEPSAASPATRPS